MDDATIVRTLAEFEGWNFSPAFENVYPWREVSSEPGYLTSYDAVARIYQKIDRELCGPWFRFTPRQHAEALAMDIAKRTKGATNK